jgi:uncharacterized protein
VALSEPQSDRRPPVSERNPPSSRGRAPGSRRYVSFVDRLVAIQARKPWILLAFGAVLTAISVVLAMRLTMRTGFESLLPETRPSVLELRRVSERVRGVSALFIVLEAGPNAKAESLRKAGDALVVELGKLGPPYVGSAESGIHEAARYLEPRAGLFAPLPKLKQLRDEIKARHEYEVAKATNMLLDDDPPPEMSEKRARKILGIDESGLERFPEGYYQSADGRTLVVSIRSKVTAGDFSLGVEAMQKVREVIQRANVAQYDPSIKWGFAGDLASGVAEYSSMQADLVDVGVFGAILVFGVVLLYYLRFRTLLAMLLNIAIGVIWTFGMSKLLVGHLTIATGFLFTIIGGNGINFAILFMARYLEARHGGFDLAAALRTAHRETWVPTLTAACAAAASYGSLVLTEFRGFKDFGYIGSVGMVLCWSSTYLMLPCILAVLEKLAPISAPKTDPAKKSWLDRIRGGAHGGLSFGAPFAALAQRFPRSITVLGAALTVAGLVATLLYIRSDPMEYDLKQLRTDMSKRTEEIRLNKVADDLTGFVGLDGMAIAVDRHDQVAPLRAILEQRRDTAPEGKKPFKGVHTLDDFVPADQAEKIPIMLEIRGYVEKAKERGLLKGKEMDAIWRFMPPLDIKPIAMNDLPDALSRPFTEVDGTKGRIVYLSPIGPGAVDDAHYLFRWADSYRETKLPDGSVIRGSGRAVIYADMWAAVLSDVPRAVIFSFVATALVVAIAFKGRSAAAIVLGALMVGIFWMGASLALLDIRLSFMNFVALPITFGIGVDYAVNVVQRYREEGAGGAIVAVQSTGGAVILCSLTTMLGYLALIRSANNSVRSLGIAASVGEICCIIAAVLVLPAALTWKDNRAAVRAQRLSRG